MGTTSRCCNGKVFLWSAILLSAVVFVAAVVTIFCWTIFNQQAVEPVSSPLQGVYNYRNTSTLTGPVPWQTFNGKWNLVGSENWEDYLVEIGVPWIFRKMAAKVSFYVTIKVDDNLLKMQTITTFNEQPMNEYRVNGPETMVDNNSRRHRAKTTWRSRDKVLIVEMSQSEDGRVKPQRITRQIVNGVMYQTLEIGKVVARQRFVKAA